MINSFPFLGLWRGRGTVLSGFAYEEELSLELFGTPVAKQVKFWSKTWKDGSSYEENPVHSEIGMMKVRYGDDQSAAVELLLSHPFGMTEIETGEFRNGVMQLGSFSISRSPTASNAIVEAIRRVYWLEGSVLKYELYLKVIDKPEYLHLQAGLNRIG